MIANVHRLVNSDALWICPFFLGGKSCVEVRIVNPSTLAILPYNGSPIAISAVDFNIHFFSSKQARTPTTPQDGWRSQRTRGLLYHF